MEDKEITAWMVIVSSALAIHLGNHDKAWARVFPYGLAAGATLYAALRRWVC